MKKMKNLINNIFNKYEYIINENKKLKKYKKCVHLYK